MVDSQPRAGPAGPLTGRSSSSRAPLVGPCPGPGKDATGSPRFTVEFGHMGWWVTDVKSSLGVPGLVSWVFWVIFSIVLHELGHGWTALRCGDRTPVETGHMTWNPMVHMGPASLVVFAVAGIAWGLMPINPSRLRGRHDEALVAVAGPAVNLMLAVFCTVAGALWIAAASPAGWGVLTPGDTLYRNLQVFFILGAMLNFGLLLFNLIPVPPLDGSRIAATFVPAYRRAIEGPNAQGAAVAVFLLVFLFGGQHVFGFAMETAIEGRERVLAMIAPGL